MRNIFHLLGNLGAGCVWHVRPAVSAPATITAVRKHTLPSVYLHLQKNDLLSRYIYMQLTVYYFSSTSSLDIDEGERFACMRPCQKFHTYDLLRMGIMSLIWRTDVSPNDTPQ